MTTRPSDENEMNATLESVLRRLQPAATTPDADPTIVALYGIALVLADTRRLVDRPLAPWTEDPHRTRPARPSSLAQSDAVVDPSAQTLDDNLTATAAAADQQRRACKRQLAEKLRPADADLGNFAVGPRVDPPRVLVQDRVAGVAGIAEPPPSARTLAHEEVPAEVAALRAQLAEARAAEARHRRDLWDLLAGALGGMPPASRFAWELMVSKIRQCRGGRLGEVIIDQAIQISELRTASLGPDADTLADFEERISRLETAGAALRHSIARALQLPATSDEFLIDAVTRAAAGLAELRSELTSTLGLEGETRDAELVGRVSQMMELLGGTKRKLDKNRREDRGSTQRIRRTYRVFGLDESQVSTECSALLAAEPSAELAIIHFQVEFPEVLIDLAVRSAGDSAEAQQCFDRLEVGLRTRLGPALYGSADETLVERVKRRLLESGAAFATAESCTGGMVGELITSLPGASQVFPGGAIVYSNAEKERQLGVRGSTLAAHGAVSRETVVEMALGALDRFGTKLAVSISGIAGPDGATPGKPVGTVWLAVASRLLPGEPTVATRKLEGPGTRSQIRRLSAWWALAMVDATLPTDDPAEIARAHWILTTPRGGTPA